MMRTSRNSSVFGMNSTNPIYNSVEKSEATTGVALTAAGVIRKTIILLILAIISGTIVCLGMQSSMGSDTLQMDPVSGSLLSASIFLLLIGSIGSWFSVNPIFAFMYSIGYGAMLGAISTVLEFAYPGIVSTAIIATGIVFSTTLILYLKRIVRVTDKFRSIVKILVCSYCIFIFVSFMISFISGSNEGGMMGNSSTGIGIGAIAILIGAAMLLLDFDRIEKMSEAKADVKYEWRIAFGLTATVLWIYIEILRLLARLAAKSRD